MLSITLYISKISKLTVQAQIQMSVDCNRSRRGLSTLSLRRASMCQVVRKAAAGIQLKLMSHGVFKLSGIESPVRSTQGPILQITHIELFSKQWLIKGGRDNEGGVGRNEVSGRGEG